MSETIDLTQILKELKECQRKYDVSSCGFCKKYGKCDLQSECVEAINTHLALKTQELQECQIKHQYSSCMQCKEMLECPLRLSYVEDVYLSMNKGNGGSFEF
ncbi:hypothetical protein [Helicobacter burdigaliensis]|uniref:hypothetical protein n=1 Tax=Helicobacter burdigaliensis TaxID=2315334 RepID=UPI0018E55E1C|nr:hypothetical protein [Helicobacter burdigaliensis]